MTFSHLGIHCAVFKMTKQNNIFLNVKNTQTRWSAYDLFVVHSEIFFAIHPLGRACSSPQAKNCCTIFGRT